MTLHDAKIAAVRALLAEAGWKQQEAAAAMGTTRPQISRWMSRGWTDRAIDLLLVALGMEIQDFARELADADLLAVDWQDIED
jgi:predicted XRE-type DNA-binding protein